VDDTSKAAVIDQLLEKGYSDDVWKALAAQYPDVATRLAAAQIQIDRQAAIKDLRSRSSGTVRTKSIGSRSSGGFHGR